MRKAVFDWDLRADSGLARLSVVHGCRVRYLRRAQSLCVLSMEVAPEDRGGGRAKRAMTLLLQEADALEQTVTVASVTHFPEFQWDRACPTLEAFGFSSTPVAAFLARSESVMHRTPQAAALMRDRVAFPMGWREWLPVNAWVALPYPDIRGTPIARIVELDPGPGDGRGLYLPEIDDAGNLVDPAKRRYVDAYEARLRAGGKPPVVDLVEMEDGRLRMVDGHRRLLAAQRVGARLRAQVSVLDQMSEPYPVPLVMERFEQWVEQASRPLEHVQANGMEEDANRP